MFRKKHIEEIGLYDESFRLHEERELRIRFEKNIEFTDLNSHSIVIVGMKAT